MNLPKITGYMGITCILVSLLAQFCARVIPEPGMALQLQDILRWASYLWAYAALVMGCYLKQNLGKPLEAVLGLGVAILCLVFEYGVAVAVGYLFRSYVKLDKTDAGLPF